MALTYSNCTLCPRHCGVDRSSGALGFCGMGGAVRVARAAPHYWEEPVLSAQTGSGTVFFSGCTLRCSFCQNEKISSGGFGRDLTPARLREIFEQLVDAGVQNINLVTPTHFLPDILPALTPKLPVPIVYNCGGYESVETLKELEGLVDIYLPDFKYSNSALAATLSAAPDYPRVAEAAIREMLRQTGPAVIEDGIMRRGVIVRHLILPGHIDNSLGVIDILSRFPKDSFLFSLMQQYTPAGAAAKTPPFNRRVSEIEADSVLSWAWLNGLENGYFQQKESAEASYIPDFSLQGVDKPWEDML